MGAVGERIRARRFALPRWRLHEALLHPLFWTALAMSAGAAVGLMVGRFRLRYFKLVLGLTFALAVLRYPTYVGAGLFLIIYSFPSPLWIGDTNTIFVLFLLVIWLGRAAMRQEPSPRRTPIDTAVVIYLIALAVALLHIETAQDLNLTWRALRNLIMPIGMFYVLFNSAYDSRKMLFVTEMFLLGIGFVFFSVFMEHMFPGVHWLPAGFLTKAARGALEPGAAMIRYGGVYSHAQLADATAIAFVLRIYLGTYYRHNRLMRAYHFAFALLSVYVMSLTGNRGGLLVMMGGAAYFLWIFRRQFTLTRVVAGAVVLTALFIAMEFALFQFQGEGSLLGRLIRTRLVSGIPETRVHAWTFIWGRIQESPLIGHGMVYTFGEAFQGALANWPHNALLHYLYAIGIVGPPVFLYLCYRVIRGSWAGQGLSIHGAPLARGLAATCHVGVLQFLVGQLRTDHQRNDHAVWLMWTVFALALIAGQVWDRERPRGVGGRAMPPTERDLTRTAPADDPSASERTG